MREGERIMSDIVGVAVEIDAPANSRDNRYINSMKLNGSNHDLNFVTHDQLTNGAILTFDMTSEPNTSRGTSAESAPYSFSKEK